MRYVSEEFLVSTLRRGQSLEQFLGACTDTKAEYVQCLEIRPSESGFEVWRHVAEDLGDEDFVDFYDFIVDEDDDGNEIGPMLICETPDQALAYAENNLGASRARWAIMGITQYEYEAFIKAGRPSIWPPR